MKLQILMLCKACGRNVQANRFDASPYAEDCSHCGHEIKVTLTAFGICTCGKKAFESVIISNNQTEYGEPFGKGFVDFVNLAADGEMTPGTNLKYIIVKEE
jgi:hypothetical protein